MLNWNNIFTTNAKSQRKNAKKNLRLEPLEGRRLLAGDIAIEFAESGDLLVTGDIEANEAIIADGGDGSLVIVGVDGTNLIYDGVSAESHEIVLPEGVETIRDLKIDLGDGDDNVQLENLHVGRSLKALLRDGDDFISFDNLTIDRHVSISNGPGTDEISIDFADVGERLAINGGEGDFTFTAENVEVGMNLHLNATDGDDDLSIAHSEISGDVISKNIGGEDTVTLENSQVYGNFIATNGTDRDEHSLPYSYVQGDVTVNSQDGNAYINMHGTTIDGNVNITNGNGYTNGVYMGEYTQVGGNVTIAGGEGSDVFDISYGSEVTGDLTIMAGDGADYARIGGYSYYEESSVTVQGSTVLDMAGGENAVFIDDFFAGESLTITSGAEDDLVMIDDLQTSESLNINTASGDDEVSLDNVMAEFDIEISTSSGDDQVQLDEVYAENLTVNLGTASFADHESGYYEGFGDFRLGGSEQGDSLAITDTEIDSETSILSSIGHHHIDVEYSSLGNLTVRTSAGVDVVSLMDVDAEETSIRTGSGDDFVTLDGDSEFSELDVALGSGQDEFMLYGEPDFASAIYVHGGSGFDSTNFDEFGPFVFESFENFGSGSLS